MKILRLILFIDLQAIWILHYSLFQAHVDARATAPHVSPLSAPLSSPQTIPVSPFTATMPSISPEISAKSGGVQKQTSKKLIQALIIASIALGAIMLSLLCLWIHHRKRSQKSNKNNTQSSGLALGPTLSKVSSMRMSGKNASVTLFDYGLLETATDNFQESNILGVGGFGCVYKACLDDNFHVAVKKLDCASQDAEREFENEVDLLKRIQHPNIISLLGYCIHGEMRFIVYELMQNGSLETQLHGPSHGAALNWRMRMKIALDAARC